VDREMNETLELVVNWTSPHLPLWQVDCEDFRKSESPFEIRDVGPEIERFVKVYAQRFNLEIQRKHSTVRFIPKKVALLEPSA
jgi:hypothetical protein